MLGKKKKSKATEKKPAKAVKKSVDKAKKDTKPRVIEVVDMDKKLAEAKTASGRTRFQQYLREKINNADIK